MIITRSLLSLALLVGLCGSVNAFDDDTRYIYGFGGVGFLSELTSDTGSTTIPFDSGYHFGIGMGRKQAWFNGSRLEIEGVFSAFDSSTINQSPGGSANVDSEVRTSTIMVNLLKDFPISDRLNAYIGGGIGYSITELNINAPGGIDDESSSVAYQFIIGLDFPFGHSFSAFTEYRLLGIAESEFIGQNNFDSFTTSNLVFGMRYSF